MSLAKEVDYSEDLLAEDVGSNPNTSSKTVSQGTFSYPDITIPVIQLPRLSSRVWELSKCIKM